MEKVTKEVTLGENVYEINPFTPRVGSWILAQVLTKIFPSAIESQLGIDNSMKKTEMSEEEFHNIQDHCLAVVKRFVDVGGNRVAMSIMKDKERFAMPDLEYDLITVMALTVHVLLFNIVPFFDADRLKSVLQTFQDSPLFNRSA